MKRQFLDVLKDHGIKNNRLAELRIQSLSRKEIGRIAAGIDPTPAEARRILKALGLAVRLAKGCRLRPRADQYRSYAERRFAVRMRLRGLTMIPQPRAFKVGVTTWTPDFYCPELDLYYEVVGSQQAWDQSKEKIQLVRAIYPRLQIKVVTSRCEVLLEGHRVSQRVKRLGSRIAGMFWGMRRRDVLAALEEANRLSGGSLFGQS